MNNRQQGGESRRGTGPSAASSKFAYLSNHNPRLAEVATRAERVLGLDPVAALQHLRLFGELLPATLRHG